MLTQSRYFKLSPFAEAVYSLMDYERKQKLFEVLERLGQQSDDGNSTPTGSQVKVDDEYLDQLQLVQGEFRIQYVRLAPQMIEVTGLSYGG